MADGIHVTLRPAGHILGSAPVTLRVDHVDRTREDEGPALERLAAASTRTPSAAAPS